jgi:hypothetical protein
VKSLGSWKENLLTNLCQLGHLKNVVDVKVFLKNKELLFIDVIKLKILPN